MVGLFIWILYFRLAQQIELDKHSEKGIMINNGLILFFWSLDAWPVINWEI